MLSSEGLKQELGQAFGFSAIRSGGPAAAAAHQLSLGWIGPHRLAAWLGTAVVISAERPPPLTLYLLRGGWLEWEDDGQRRSLQPGSLLLVGDSAYTLRSGVCAVVVIALDRDRLEQQLRGLAPLGLAADPLRQLLARPLLLEPEAAPCGGLVQAFSSLMDLYERLELQDPRLVVLLEIDRLLERLIAALLLTAAFGGEALEQAASTALKADREAAFEALLGRIRSHLAEPLDLGMLAAWAQCPPRRLQAIFQERLACTPMQWLRAERLRRARQLLERGAAGDTVAAIARRCGYPSAAHFSEDFRRQFGCTPSLLLRAAREAPREGGMGLLADA